MKTESPPQHLSPVPHLATLLLIVCCQMSPVRCNSESRTLHLQVTTRFGSSVSRGELESPGLSPLQAELHGEVGSVLIRALRARAHVH